MMKALIIEDNPDHQAMTVAACRNAFGTHLIIDTADDLKPGLDMLRGGNYDVCLCDLDYPESKTQDTIESLHELKTNTAVVVVTFNQNEALARDLLHFGIQDFINKGDINTDNLKKSMMFAIERKRYQTLLEERNQDREAFCASLSHDFTGSISAIKQLTQKLKASLNDDRTLTTKQDDLFTFILEHTHQVNDLVEGLKTFLRIDVVDATPDAVDINVLAEDVKEAVLGKAKDPQATITIEGGLTQPLIGNRSHLFLMLQNLLSNGLKFSPETHTVTLSFSEDLAHNECKIAVTDQGIGMNEEQISQIFLPFSRVHTGEFEGTGLGLSIVHRIVQTHHGHLKVISHPGEGTTFEVTLPISPTEPE